MTTTGVRDENELCLELVSEILDPIDYSALPIATRRRLQFVVVVRHILLTQDATGNDAITVADAICRKTVIGTGFLHSVRILSLLDRALAPLPYGRVAIAQPPEVIIIACNRAIRALAPTARLEDWADDNSVVQYLARGLYVPASAFDDRVPIEQSLAGFHAADFAVLADRLARIGSRPEVEDLLSRLKERIRPWVPADPGELDSDEYLRALIRSYDGPSAMDPDEESGPRSDGPGENG